MDVSSAKYGSNRCWSIHTSSYNWKEWPAASQPSKIWKIWMEIFANFDLQSRCSESHRGIQRRNLDWGNRIEAQVLMQIYLPLRDILTALQPPRDRLAGSDFFGLLTSAWYSYSSTTSEGQTCWIWFLWFSLCNPIPTRYSWAQNNPQSKGSCMRRKSLSALSCLEYLPWHNKADIRIIVICLICKMSASWISYGIPNFWTRAAQGMRVSAWFFFSCSCSLASYLAVLGSARLEDMEDIFGRSLWVK